MNLQNINFIITKSTLKKKLLDTIEKRPSTLYYILGQENP
jgi:hypothetical protein